MDSSPNEDGICCQGGAWSHQTGAIRRRLRLGRFGDTQKPFSVKVGRLEQIPVTTRRPRRAGIKYLLVEFSTRLQ